MTGDAGPPCFATAFGLRWQADLPLTQFRDDDRSADPDVVLGRLDRLPDRDVLQRIHRGEIFADGFRLRWSDEVVFDVRHDGESARTHVGWFPGASWRGHFPHALFGTVTGLLVAWRGAIPLHACAVAMNGRGVVLCGLSGAGKSTLTAGLATHGATLLSDDLSVLVSKDGGEWLQPGRPALRLFPEIADWLPGATSADAGPGARGKLLVRPAAAPASDAVPLAAIVFISRDPVPGTALMKVAALKEQLFRPRWLAKLPGQRHRLARIASLAQSIPMLAVEPAARLDETSWRAHSAMVSGMIDAALR